MATRLWGGAKNKGSYCNLRLTCGICYINLSKHTTEFTHSLFIYKIWFTTTSCIWNRNYNFLSACDPPVSYYRNKSFVVALIALEFHLLVLHKCYGCIIICITTTSTIVYKLTVVTTALPSHHPIGNMASNRSIIELAEMFLWMVLSGQVQEAT